MMKSTIVIAGIGLVMLAVGVFGIVSGTDSNAMTNLNRNYNASSRMNGWSDDSYGGMMGNQGNVFSNKDYSNTEKQSNEVLEEQVEKYISQFDEALEISDVFIFSDTDYYYSIIETETGRGAMELLVNPYTGSVYPEYGPNMMWNLKYGMMGSQSGMGYGGMMGSQSGMGYGGMMGSQSGMGYGGMMGSQSGMGYGGMMGSQGSNGFGDVEENVLSVDEALSKANNFIEKQSADYNVTESYHEFYGYYTFHVEYEGQSNGMLSVNAFTGEVWFHDWHGDLIEILGSHEEE